MSSSEYILQTCCLLKNVKVLGKQCEVLRDTSATEQQDALCYAASQRWHLPPGPESPPASMQTPGWVTSVLSVHIGLREMWLGKCQGVWYRTPPVPRPAFAPHPSRPPVPPADATAIIWAQVDLTASDFSSTPSSPLSTPGDSQLPHCVGTRPAIRLFTRLGGTTCPHTRGNLDTRMKGTEVRLGALPSSALQLDDSGRCST